MLLACSSTNVLYGCRSSHPAGTLETAYAFVSGRRGCGRRRRPAPRRRRNLAPAAAPAAGLGIVLAAAGDFGLATSTSPASGARSGATILRRSWPLVVLTPCRMPRDKPFPAARCPEPSIASTYSGTGTAAQCRQNPVCRRFRLSPHAPAPPPACSLVDDIAPHVAQPQQTE
jgi:hypothetical protein